MVDGWLWRGCLCRPAPGTEARAPVDGAGALVDGGQSVGGISDVARADLPLGRWLERCGTRDRVLAKPMMSYEIRNTKYEL